MRKLLEKYYNINFYCSYKLLFFIFWRMLNPFYWLSFSKWKNGYINRCISTNKRHEAAGMDKGVDVYISSMASNTPYIISVWAFCLVCLVYFCRFHVPKIYLFITPFFFATHSSRLRRHSSSVLATVLKSSPSVWR